MCIWSRLTAGWWHLAATLSGAPELGGFHRRPVVHLILDNYATHKHAKVRTWLAKQPRYHVHYTRTYSPWFNQVERWFGLITQHAIRRSSSRTAKELIRRIAAYGTRHDRITGPFTWTPRPIRSPESSSDLHQRF